MPYAPGIQDISGQLIAQGMSQAGAARARAIESIGESIAGGIRQYQQNRIITQQALGKFGQGLENPEFKQYVTSILSEDPNAPQVSPAIKTAVKNAQKGNVDVYDAALLSSVVDTFAKNKEQQSQDMLRRAQSAQLFAQTAQMADEIRRRQALARMMEVPFYGDAEEPAMKPAKAEAPAQAPAVAPQAAAAQPRAAVSPSVQAAAASAARFAIPSDLQGFTPDVAQAAQREAALEFLSSGKMANRTMIAQRIAAERRKQMGEERELTLDEGKQQQEAFNLAEQQKPLGQRRAMNLRPTTRPGFVAPEIVLAEATGVEKQAQEAKTQAEKDRLTRISSVIMNDRKVAEGSRSIAPALNRLDSLIGEDKIEGGTLAEFKLNAMSMAKSLGFNVDENQLASGQTARAYFGQTIIPLFINTKGATSDRDAVLFASWNPSLALNNKANAEMIKIMKLRVELDRNLEKLGNLVDSEDITHTEYVKRRQKLISDYDDSLPDLDTFLSAAGAAPRKISSNLSAAPVNPAVTAAAVRRDTAQGASTSAGLFEKLMNDAKARKSPGTP